MGRVLAVVLVALLGLAACGSDHKEDNAYVAAVNRAQDDFAATFARLSRRITSTSSATQDRRTLQAFRGAVDRAVGRLRALKVPPRVEAEHARLVDAIASYGRAITRAQRAFRSGDPQDVLTAQTQLASAVTRASVRINRAIEAINGRLRG